MECGDKCSTRFYKILHLENAGGNSLKKCLPQTHNFESFVHTWWIKVGGTAGSRGWCGWRPMFEGSSPDRLKMASLCPNQVKEDSQFPTPTTVHWATPATRQAFLCGRDETVQCKATWERKRCVCLGLPDHSTLLKELMVGNQARSNQTKTMEDYCLLLIPSNIQVKTMAQRILLLTVSWVLLLQLIFMEIPHRVPAGQWDMGNSSIETPL